jgi:ribonuclease J
MGIAVTTPLGVVVHTGDFKIDHTPADGMRTDFTRLSQIVGDGALLLFSDSTYAEVEGYTESEQTVGEALDRVIGDADGRVMIATFASLISRVQQIINAAVKYDRKVTAVGRSMVNNVKMALDMGYLDAPDGVVIPMSQARQLPAEEVVIVATGSQGEPTSALVRIANGRHNDIELVPGDTVVLSASPIPGNETVVARTIDNLIRQGATVLYSRISMVHVHGHAAREELKMMLSIVRPRYFVPVHGEYRHLTQHAGIASDMGIPASRVFVLEDGDVLELDSDFATVVESVQAGHVFIDGKQLWDMDSAVLTERRRLSRDGVVTVTVTLSAKTGLLLADPVVHSYGFVDLDNSDTIFENASKRVSSFLEDSDNDRLDLDHVKSRLTRSVADFLYGETRRRPTVLTVIEQV